MMFHHGYDVSIQKDVEHLADAYVCAGLMSSGQEHWKVFTPLGERHERLHAIPTALSSLYKNIDL